MINEPVTVPVAGPAGTNSGSAMIATFCVFFTLPTELVPAALLRDISALCVRRNMLTDDLQTILPEKSDSDEDVNHLTINEYYAKAYELRKEKQELARCKFSHPCTEIHIITISAQ